MQDTTNHSFFSLKIFFILFAIMGIFSTIHMSADAAKAEGKSGWKYGSATAGIVCGDKLCSEIEKKSERSIHEKKSIKHSPLAQHKMGVPIHQINCNDGFSLVMKSSSGTPACIKEKSVDTLFTRGWASPVMIN